MALQRATPNLIVEDVAATLDWYRTVLGATVLGTVPDDPDDEPLDWAQVAIDDVPLMVQSRGSLSEELPRMVDLPLGGSVCLSIDAEDVEELHGEPVEADVDVVLDLRETFYGRREFAVTESHGYVLWVGEKANGNG